MTRAAIFSRYKTLKTYTYAHITILSTYIYLRVIKNFVIGFLAFAHIMYKEMIPTCSRFYIFQTRSWAF